MATELDPVCGMTVDVQKSTPSTQATYEGKAYHFCSTGCKAMWDANPQKYATKAVAV